MLTFNARFDGRFPEFAVEGDMLTKAFRLGDSGPFLTIRATIHNDPDASPHDCDCYTPEQIALWEQGDWFFRGVTVEVLVDGRVTQTHSRWGIDGDGDYLTQVADELLGQVEFPGS